MTSHTNFVFDIYWTLICEKSGAKAMRNLNIAPVIETQKNARNIFKLFVYTAKKVFYHVLV